MDNKKVLIFIVGVVLLFTVPFYLLNKSIKSLEEENKLLKDEIKILENENMEFDSTDSEVIEATNDEESKQEDEADSKNNTQKEFEEKVNEYSHNFVDLMFNRFEGENMNELKSLVESDASDYLEAIGYFKTVDDASEIPSSEIEEVKAYTRNLENNKKDLIIVYGTSSEDDDVINYGIYHLEVELKDNGEVVATNMYGDNPLMNPDIELYFGREAVDQ